MIDYDAMEAAGLCECGAPLDDHPPIPPPRPWSYGRPCSKTAPERGIGWDGQPAVEHAAKNQSRWSSLGRVAAQPEPEPRKKLTRRQAEALRVLNLHGGKQSAARLELGITSASMSLMVKRLRRIGAYFPPQSA